MRRWSLLVMLLLVILAALPFAAANLHIEKDTYLLGERVDINIDTAGLGKPALWITTPEGRFRYNGELDKPITYTPAHEGDYAITLEDKLDPGFQETHAFTVRLEAGSDEGIHEAPAPPMETAPIALVSAKTVYIVGETITIDALPKTEPQPGWTLYVQGPEDHYRYMGFLRFPLSFPTRTPGRHTVELRNSAGSLIAQLDFDVVEELYSPPGNETGGNRTAAAPPTLPPTNLTADVTTNTSANISEKTGTFDTTPSREPVKLPGSSIAHQLALKDSHGHTFTTTIELKQSGEHSAGRAASASTSVSAFDASAMSIEPASYDVTLLPERSPVMRLRLDSLAIGGEKLALGLDDVPGERVRLLAAANAEAGIDTNPETSLNAPVVNSYAIDLTGANFTNGSATIIAKGTALYKCAAWNFTNQSCEGTWVKVMDLVPGEAYTIPLFPGDPGYAETGLATVNTERSIYTPGSTARLLMVVLDVNGHLVKNASVKLTVTAPDNSSVTYTTGAGQITEEQKGIYVATHTLSLLGNHTLDVTASAPGVNSTMHSFVIVADSYPYNILRTSPATTDPWKSPFTTNITVVALNASMNFNYTERLPAGFTIENQGGATLASDTIYQYLTWTGLSSGATVSYVARPPLVTPELYSLRGTVTYGPGQNSFLEARPWWLAVDPETSYAAFESGDIDLCVLGNETFAIAWCQNEADPNDQCRLAVYNTNGTLIDNIDLDSGSAIYSRVGISCINSTDMIVAHINATPETLLVARYKLSAGTLSLADGWDQLNADYADAGEDYFDTAVTTMSDTYSVVFGGNNQNEDMEGYRIAHSNLAVNGPWQYDGRMDSDTPWDNLVDGCAYSSTRIAGCWFDDRNGNFFRVRVMNETGAQAFARANVDGEIGADGAVACDCMRNDRIAFGWYDSSNTNLYIRVGDFTGDSTSWVIGATNIDGNPGTSPRLAVGEIDNGVSSLFGIIWNDQNNGNIKVGIYNESGTQVTAPFVITSSENTNELYRMVDIAGGDSLRGLKLCDSKFVVAYTKNDGSSYWDAYDVDGTQWNGVCPKPPTIHSTQCNKQGTGWVACDSLTSGDVMTSVRADCTSGGGDGVKNVTFVLQNVDKGRTYFNVTTFDNSTGYWEYNINDMELWQAGAYSLQVTCRENPTNTTTINWTLPYGNASITLIDPFNDTIVLQNKTWNFSVQINCTIGECGDFRVTLDPSVPWDNASYEYRTHVNLTEPQSTARTNEHFLASFTLAEDILPDTAENSTVMYCNGTQVPWDAYAIATSNGWITELEGVLELDIGANETYSCYVYMDPVYSGTEMPMTTTGWGYVSDGDTAATTAWKDLTPAGVDCSGQDDDGEWEAIYPCTGADSTTYGVNEWCYFLGQTSGNQDFWRNSDDCSVLYVNGTNVAEGCYNQPDSGSYATTINRYYNNTVYWAENTGGNYMRMALGTTDTGQELDTECLPYLGDEWLLTAAYGSTEQNGKGVVPMNAGSPFYTFTQNPANGSTFSCLRNMTAGVSCNITWLLNTTGEIDTVWEFFATFESLNYTNVSNGESAHVNVTIMAAIPPQIGTVECYEGGVGWGACSNIGWYDNLTKVRAQCTPGGTGSVQNVSFRLINVPDNKTFFDVMNTSEAGGWWTYDVSDLTIKESGLWNLHVTCRENPTAEKDVNWSVPYASLVGTLLNPVSATDVVQYRLFNFSALVNCTGTGECGDIQATIDPPLDWDDTNYEHRQQVNFTEPQGLARTDTHSLFNFTIQEGELSTSGADGTVMYCNGTQVPWDAYAIATNNSWVTRLEGLATITIGASSNLTCYVYFDPVYVGTESLPTGNGWEYVCDNGYDNCGTPGTVTSANYDYYGTYASVNMNPITCNGDGSSFTHNLWCYYKAPSTGSPSFSISSDDGSELFIDNTLLVDNTACQATNCLQQTSAVTQGTYYALKATYDESGGSNDLYIRTDPTTCGAGDPSGGNVLDTECYSYLGDSWLLGVTLGSRTNASKGAIPMNTGTPFYTLTQNPANSSTFSCLKNMTAGDSCPTTWVVNTTGDINTTWEFFVSYRSFNYSANITDGLTSKVNLTIVENSIPNVTSISLTPTYPVDSDDLNCTFVVTDGNALDVLTANVSWYRNGTYYSSSIQSVTRDVAETVILRAGNTSIGDTWICGVRPSDASTTGSQTNSTQREVLISNPPLINAIHCLEGVWGNCPDVIYGDTLLGVRANCTDVDGYVVSARFNLTNLQDGKSFFANLTTDNASYPGYWYFDNDDLLITDSGNFSLAVTCTDDQNVSRTESSDWYIPFGTRTINLITYPSNANVTWGQFFNFSAMITCTGGECDSYNATIDPPDSWDAPSYKYRRQVNFTEPQGVARTDEHIRVDLTMTAGILPAANENGTSMYCNGTRVPWDAYATTTSNGSITTLQGVAEVTFSASETKTCYVYYDTTYTQSELLPSTTGWGYFCDSNYANCGVPAEVTTANYDFSGRYADLVLNPITCGADGDTFTHNLWCYFKAPDTGLQTFGVASDDGSNISIDGTAVVDNTFCQGTYCRSGTYTTTANRYYDLHVWYDENGGGNDLYAYYNPSVCDSSGDGSGNSIGNECYPYYGGDWEITTAIGHEDTPKGQIPVNGSAQPFYTTNRNPRSPNDLACLLHLAGGDSCEVWWLVNATGPINSTHEFYVEFTPWNYTPLTGPDFSASVNLTIIGNAPPSVSFINISPEFPIPSENLTCAFIVNDQNLPDTLTVNLTWYRNNISYSSKILNVTNSVLSTDVLNASETTLNDKWHCGARPFDEQVYGNQVNSSVVVILNNRPPTITNIQCREGAASWETCNNVLYSDNLTGVRATCTDIDGQVMNASFVLQNYPDNKTFINGTTTDNSTYPGYWYLDSPDFLIKDSGTWNLTVTCTDNNASSNSEHVQWAVPWGTMIVNLINPAGDTNVQRYAFFNFTARLTCTNGECGSFNATLDPMAWDNESFRYRISVNVTEPQNMGRNDTHFMLNFTVPLERLNNENGSAMYCDGNRVAWDAYATSMNGSWVTGLKGLAELSINASQTLQCFVYVDPDYNATEILPSTTGWSYVGASGYAGGNYVDLATTDVDCYGEDADGQFPNAICGATDNIKLNEWCYFKAPNTDATFYFKTGSDDGSGLWFDELLAVGDNNGPHGVQWRDNVCGACTGALSVTQDEYYALEIDYAENTGGEELNNRWNGAAGDDNTGNVMDTECYPYYGDEWLLTISKSTVSPRQKGVIPMYVGYPFYTLDQNPMAPQNLSCLANMTAGDSCDVRWAVNATGEVNTSHVFFVTGDPIDYPGYVGQSNSSTIIITITDAALVPPVVTLEYPANGTWTNDGDVVFNCSATDNLGLVNFSLYADFNGTFKMNETQSSSGLADSKLFSKTLKNGTYLWNCLVYDTDDNFAFYGYNYTIFIDTVMPNITLYAPTPAQVFFTSTVQFNYTATDNMDPILSCNLTLDHVVEHESVPSANGSLISLTVSDVTEGTHYWNVTCRDNANNSYTTPTRNFTIQDLPPSIELLTANETWFASSTAILYFNATDNINISNGTLYLDGSANQTRYNIVNGALENFTVNGLPDGEYAWSINVTDTGGLSNLSESRIFYIDTQAPRINLSYPPNNFNTSNATVPINFTVVDNSAPIMLCNITVNGTVLDLNFNATNGTPTVRNVTFPDGIMPWNVTCQDLAGNRNTSETRTINVSSPPIITLVWPQDGYSQNESALTLIYLPSDNSGLASCSLILNGIVNDTDLAPVNDDNNSFTPTGLADGVYAWAINCTDDFGLSTLSENRTFTIDSEAPNVTLLNPVPADTVFGDFQLFNFTVTDAYDSMLVCNLSVDANITGNTNFNASNGSVTTRNFTLQNEGIHFWYAECVDDAGNYGVSETRNFTSYSPPTVTLVSPYDGLVQNSSDITLVYYVFDSSAVNSTLLILNGIPNQSDSSPTNGVNNNFTLIGLPDGYYNWTVNATDDDNLTSSAGVVWFFTIDSTPPNVTTYEPSEGSTMTNNTVAFNFTANDTFSTNLTCNFTTYNYTILLNVTSGSTVTVYQNMTDGNYNWSVVCYDVANNTDTSETINFTVEAPPSVTLLSPPNPTRTTNTTQLFSYRPFDVFGIENCTMILDGATNESSSSVINGGVNSFLVNDILEGFHNWTILCYDVAPDFNPYSPPVWNYTVDLSGPNIILNFPGEGDTLNTNNITFNWTPTDDPGVALTCDLFLDGSLNVSGIGGTSGDDFTQFVTNLSDGDHNWSVNCTDDLGNWNMSVTGNFTINQPDLLINDSSVWFNETNPDVNQNITILANVTNLGGIPASNVLVSFYDGNPASGGTLIANDTLASVGINATVTASVTWFIPEGFHEIWILVDPLQAIGELNETNNNASITISTLVSRINSPGNGTTFNYSAFDLNFTIADYTGGTLNYTVFVDGLANETGSANDNKSTIQLMDLTDGRHEIRIQAEDALARKKNSTLLIVYIDTTAPQVHWITQNQSWFNSSTATIFFNITDELSTNISYEVFLDYVYNRSAMTTNGTLVNETFSGLSEGLHTLIIQATDEMNNTANSTILYFSVDLTPPVPSIETLNQTWFNTQTPDIDFNITDNLDDPINYTFFVDGALDSGAAGVAPNGTSTNDTLSSLAEGNHTLLLQAEDEAGNKENSTAIIIWIDITDPNIQLHNPLPNASLISRDVFFNFTATDNLDTLLNCTLTVSGEGDVNLSATSGLSTNYTLAGVSFGLHFWNVTCLDEAGNSNVSETRNFTIQSPDLTITAGNITFSNSTPIEGQNLTINATIFNLGNNDAENFTVQFWLGNPDDGGSLISSENISLLTAGANLTLVTNYTAVIGQNDIYVLVDTPLATNGSVYEEDETNNVAVNGFQVGFYDVFSGLTNNVVRVTDAVYGLLYKWNVTNATGSNIVVADSDSNLDFLSLQALGRDTTDAPQFDDFAELDAHLGSTNYTDNINVTWTTGGSPRETRNYELFRQNVLNVPIVNSTNVTAFKTGILWDSSDGGTQYNGTQDVAFITQINESKAGARGTYDYEARVPAPLSGYTAGTDTITFYVELR